MMRHPFSDKIGCNHVQVTDPPSLRDQSFRDQRCLIMTRESVNLTGLKMDAWRLCHVCICGLSLVAAAPLSAQVPNAATSGVITGIVTDLSGQPLVWAEVSAGRRLKRWNGPWFEMARAGEDQTDDRGQFRLHSLPPGEYVVAVSARTKPTPADAMRYFRTYYPGTTSLSDAQTVTVRAGVEAPISIRLIPVPVTSVSGVAVTASGAPAAANFEVSLQGVPTLVGDAGDGRLFSPTTASTRVAKDGSFSLAGIPEGK